MSKTTKTWRIGRIWHTKKGRGKPKWGVIKCISCDKQITLEEADSVIEALTGIEYKGEISLDHLEDDFPYVFEPSAYFGDIPYERWEDGDDWMSNHPEYWFDPLCFKRVMPYTVVCEKCGEKYLKTFRIGLRKRKKDGKLVPFVIRANIK